MLWATWSKGRELSELREKQKNLLAQLSAGSEPPAVAVTDTEQSKPVEEGNTPELVRLRAEVSRLTRRKQELMAVSVENARLKQQIAAPQSSGKAPLPEGYIRKSSAQNRGYDSPENTLETFLWAIRTQNITNFLDTFTPESADNMRKLIESSSRSVVDFFGMAKAMPGLRIVRTETRVPGTVKALVEMAPGVRPEPMVFQQIDGQWKLTGLP